MMFFQAQLKLGALPSAKRQEAKLPLEWYCAMIVMLNGSFAMRLQSASGKGEHS